MRLLQILILGVLCLAVYSNSFDHGYHLDDIYYVLRNPAIRDLKAVSAFFTDPSTLCAYRGNVDYRPLLTLSYALSYYVAGGYTTWWWHAHQILLHWACAAGLYLFCDRVLALSRSNSVRGERLVLPFFAAALFAVHPTASGVVNSFSARSSLLTAALLWPAILLYMSEDPACGRSTLPVGAVAWYTAALFTKVEAVGCLGVLLAFEVWRQRSLASEAGFFGCLRRVFCFEVLRRLGPFCLVTLAYFLLKARVMAPFEADAVEGAIGIKPLEYLSTQVVVWWVYVKQWFAPLALVADDATFPVYRSFASAPVPLALVAWAGVVVWLLLGWRRRPEVTFLAIAGLALLSPTSSLVPLAEMRNEHRPYLPLAVLSLAWLLPVGRALLRQSWQSFWVTAVYGGLAVLLLGIHLRSTRTRNLVFRDDLSYWGDVVAKAPSHRSLCNYGIALRSRGRQAEAHEYFERSVAKAPQWFISNINLALSWSSQGRRDWARTYLDRAVAGDAFSGTALTYRGEFLLEDRRWGDALSDFVASIPRSVDNYKNYRGAAAAAAGMAAGEEIAVGYYRKCLELDPERAAKDILFISGQFFTEAGRAAGGVTFFLTLRETLPKVWWVHENLGRLAARLGKQELAASALARSAELRP